MGSGSFHITLLLCYYNQVWTSDILHKSHTKFRCSIYFFFTFSNNQRREELTPKLDQIKYCNKFRTFTNTKEATFNIRPHLNKTGTVKVIWKLSEPAPYPWHRNKLLGGIRPTSPGEKAECDSFFWEQTWMCWLELNRYTTCCYTRFIFFLYKTSTFFFFFKIEISTRWKITARLAFPVAPDEASRGRVGTESGTACGFSRGSAVRRSWQGHHGTLWARCHTGNTQNTLPGRRALIAEQKDSPGEGRAIRQKGTSRFSYSHIRKLKMSKSE